MLIQNIRYLSNNKISRARFIFNQIYLIFTFFNMFFIRLYTYILILDIIYITTSFFFLITLVICWNIEAIFFKTSVISNHLSYNFNNTEQTITQFDLFIVIRAKFLYNNRTSEPHMTLINFWFRFQHKFVTLKTKQQNLLF